MRPERLLRVRDSNISMAEANTRTHALVIGIDKYKSGDNLEGSADDARAVRAFLSARLRVPDSQIVLLLDEAATHDAIISNFKSHLIHNDKIKNGDSIIFYYAGHSSRVGQHSVQGTVGSLVPYDGGDQDGLIHDHTMDTLLHDLANAKGNNVVIILDTCYAGGMARSSPFFVILAGCRPDERAYPYMSPEGPRGKFTFSLLKALVTVPLDRVTYKDVMKRLPYLHNQHPYCGGFNRNRLLFRTELGPYRNAAFTLKRLREKTVRVDAGSIHGVVVGTEFTLQDHRLKHLLVVDEVHSDSSILSLKSGDYETTFPEVERVLVSDWKNPQKILTVFIEQDFEQRLASMLSQPDRGTLDHEPQWIRVHDPTMANVKLRSDSARSFKIETSFDFVTETPNTIPRFEREHELNDLPNVLHVVAHFHYHLLHKSSHKLEQNVRMELYLLTDVEGQHIPNLSLGNLLKDSNEAKVDANYGFAIVNDTEHDLYPYLFYFDPSDYSIGPLYDPPPTAPLRGRDLVGSSCLSVGYGVGGGQPFEFPPGVQAGTAFIKLFVSTTYVDMDIIVQDGISQDQLNIPRSKPQRRSCSVWGAKVAIVRS